MVAEQEIMNENIGEVVDQAPGLLANMKQSFDSQVLIDKFNEWKFTLFELGVYLGIGLLVGFLVKRYIKYILFFLLFVVGLVILEQFDLVQFAFNWPKIQELFGVQPGLVAPEAGSLITVYLEWVKVNFTMVISLSIGFLLGLKIG